MKFLNSFNLSYLQRVVGSVRILPALLGLPPRRGNLLLYITNRCNSKCHICNHWQQEPKIDLSLSVIHDLIHSKTVGNHNWLIEGGEAFCHPEIELILKLLQYHKVTYTLSTNGIMTDKIVQAVSNYKVKSVNISLDGGSGAYYLSRGVNKYDDVVKTIDLIKDKTNLQIVFTASPWNNYEDYQHVKEFCKKRNLRLMFNIYSEAAKSGNKRLEKTLNIRYVLDSISLYASYYNAWVMGVIKIPCYSSLFNIPVFPTGNVHTCVSKFEPLGNLYKNSIDEIWNSKETLAKQKTNLKCNACWVSCYRYFDIKLALLTRRNIYR